MYNNPPIHTNPIVIQSLYGNWLQGISLSVLRLDQIHSIVSGNKWYKMYPFIQLCMSQKKKGIVTYGGAYSNHLLACAYLCKHYQIPTIGFVRGEEPIHWSPTLLLAKQYGMDLRFTHRKDFQEISLSPPQDDDWLYVPMGGYHAIGAIGASHILKHIDTSSYTHFITAAGTGTTAAGLCLSSHNNQIVIAISVLKAALESNITLLLPKEKHHHLQVIDSYHLGGYAKYTSDLLEWMNTLWHEHQLPTDFVYTGKAFFAIKDLINKGYFSTSNKLLVIHTGGLQGNYSLETIKKIV